jgi:molecular chaperone GrpE (heat shock protein)
LLQKNYETEHDKNKHLTVKLRQQQSQLEELSRQLKKVQDELLNAHDRLSQQQVTSHSRQNKEMMLLIK